MKTLLNALVLASVLVSQFAVPVDARSLPLAQETSTPIVSSTPTPPDVTETPSATPGTPESETATPIVESGETPELGTATPIAETPVTPEPEESKLTLRLSLDPEYLIIPDGSAVVQWEVSGLPVEPEAFSLRFALPEGVIPEVEMGSEYDEEARVLTITVSQAQGRFVIYAPGLAKRANLEAVLLENEREITRASLPIDVREQYELDNAGGQIEARGGRITLTFPENALTENAVIEVGAPSSDARPEWSLSGEPFELRAQGLQSGREMTQFDPGVEIEVQFDDLGIPEIYEDNLALFWYNPETKEWESLRTQVDKKTKTLRAVTTHFSVFDTGVNQWQAARTPSVADFQVSGFTGAGTFSLPISVPPGPGGLQPSLSLSYNSQVVDQATVNTQASWVGMGWSLETGSITREANSTTQLWDDAYSLNVAGVSTRIMYGTDGLYHAASENFWRFSYNSTNDTWSVWDKIGNIYFFEETTQTVYANDCDSEEVPGGYTEITNQWSLTRVQNIFSGSGGELTYTYFTETKEIAQGEEWRQGKCRTASIVTTDTAIYPETIVYPNGQYRIFFKRENRSDYTAAWAWDATHHDFMRSRLKTIYIQDLGGAEAFVDPVTDSSQTVRRYEFTYESTAAETIFSGFTYSASGKVSTLADVKEYGVGSDQTGLPGYTFYYEDGLHLTKAENGYGGRVDFEISDQVGFTQTTADNHKNQYNCAQVTWRARSGGDVVQNNCGQNYNTLAVRGTAIADNVLTTNSRLPMVRPGGRYGVWVNISALAQGMTVQLGASDGSTDVMQPQLFNTLGWHGVMLTLPVEASQFRPIIVVAGGGTALAGIENVQFMLYPAFHRVTEKTVWDGRGNDYTTEYSYARAAINTSDNSDVCAPDEQDCKSIVEANSQFRGHNEVTETGPDGRTTVTEYHQDDEKTGQPIEREIKDGNGTLLQKTLYTWTSTDRGLSGPPSGYDHWGFVHNWLVPAAIETRTYSEDGYAATLTVNSYESTYGNQQWQEEQVWDGGGWSPYRKTYWEYYPNTSPGKNLTGLPARIQVKDANNVLLADTINLYDDNTLYTTPPPTGKVTRVRTWVGGTQYSQVSYGYDSWGNITTTTTWSGYGTDTSAPSTGERASYTCYGTQETLGGQACANDNYHTYPLWSKNALGQMGSATYDYALGVPLSETDPNDAVTSATYDDFGRILTITRPLDSEPTLSMSYEDSFPFTTTITQRVDANTDFTLTREYDGMGRNYETTAGDVTTTIEYDGYGRAIWQSVPGGTEGTTTSYDVLGRPLVVTVPDGTYVSYAYDGLTTTVTDANGHTTTSRSDEWGRTVQVTPPAGPGVTYTYDEMGRLKTAKRGGLVTALTYDAAGRKTAMSDPDMGDWTYTYNALDMTAQTDARDCTLELGYDLIHRLTSKTSTGTCGTQVNTTYSYDAGTNGIGRRTGMTDALNPVDWQSAWTYDARGRVTSESKTITGGGTYTTEWTYNSADLPVTMTYPDDEVVSYEYNDRMLLDSLSGTDDYVTGTDYDDAGRITARALGNGLTQEFGYYPWDTQGGRLQSLRVEDIQNPPEDMQNLGYTYDPAGNITQITDSAAQETQGYEYDALDRLTEWRVNGNLSGQYGYNPSSGNLTAKGTTALSYASPPSDDPGTNGLAAWWSLDETGGARLDSQGASAMHNYNTAGYAAGVKGNAASFAPVSSAYLVAADDPAISTGNIDFTLKAHVYLNSLTGAMIVATKGDSSDMTKRDYTLFYDGASHFAFRIGNGITSSAVTSGTVAAGQWYTVTAWYDSVNDTLNIQLNNGTVTSISYTGGALDTIYPLSVGAFANGVYLLDGKVDELALYKRVLTSTERTWLYNNGQGRSYADLLAGGAGNPGITDLVAWWSLDETGGMRYDSQGASDLSDQNTTGYAAGVKSNAARFTPTTGAYLTAPDSADISTGNIDFTLKAHVYLNSGARTMIVASKGEVSDMTKRDYTLFYDETTQVFAFRVGNGSTQAAVTSTAVTTGRWYTVIAWHDSVNNTLNIQLDNGTVRSVSYVGGAMNTSQPLGVGAFSNGVFPLDGKVDELALWKRVLTSTERTWLYNSGQGRTYAEASSMTALSAWWNLDEIGGTRADSKGTNPLDSQTTVTGHTTGVNGNAARFMSATGAYLLAADNPAISTGDVDFTLRAHVYLNDVNTTTIIAIKGEKDNMTRRDYMLFVDGSAHAIGFRVGNGTTGAVVLSGTVTTGRWYTVTAWHNAAQNNLNIQLDNGTVQSVSYTGGVIDTVQPLSVGAFADGSYLLDGRVDELALYKRILTAQERTWLYNNGQGRSYADVVTNVVQYHAVAGAVTSGTCPQGETCDYDQAQAGVNNTYSYDNNGNQITRTINGVTLTLSYDAEGHLVSVTGQGINAAFTYDGDGARVKSIINNTTTYFVGIHYEVSSGVVTKYYYAGTNRVAMQQGGTLYYLLTDHLGSTSLTTNSSGSVVSELRYSAWGGVRHSSGNTPTDYTFSGQYSNVTDFGLMYYNARWYDPYLNHFTQPDSIVPDLYNSQDWDRYAYSLNNPLRYIDPSGHKACAPTKDGGCDETEENILKLIDDVEKYLKDHGGILDEDGNGIPNLPDPNAGPIKMGSSTGCTQSTYVECFYARQLFYIDGTMRIDKKQFALLMLAVYYDIDGRIRTPWDRLVYDTPFWDAYGEALGTACYSGTCYGRTEINYFAQGMWSAASGQSLGAGEWIVDIWKSQYGGKEPSAGTLYWFRAGYVMYEILNESY